MNNYDCHLTKSLGDDTFVYDIRFNKQMTVAEFIKQWVTGKKESDNQNSRFGKFKVAYGTDYYTCHYKRNSQGIPFPLGDGRNCDYERW